MVKKSRAAGSFVGGILNNPGAVILGLAAIFLLFFRGDIRNAFASAGEGLGNINIQLPSIEFPSFEFPSFEFPDVTFPSVDFGGLFGGVGQGAGDAIESTGEFFGGIAEQFTELFSNINLNPFDVPTTESEGVPIDFTESGQAAARGARGGDITEAIVDTPIVAMPVTDVPIAVSPGIAEQVIAPFTGGGVSFIGGTIREIPVERLSLSDIIDRFGVSATQARDIQFRAQEPELTGFIPEGFTFDGGGAISDPSFAGLSATEIAERLTGGLITRF